jgi:hypothetical protein
VATEALVFLLLSVDLLRCALGVVVGRHRAALVDLVGLVVEVTVEIQLLAMLVQAHPALVAVAVVLRTTLPQALAVLAS